MSMMPTTEVIGYLKASRQAARQTAAQSGFDPDVQPFTYEQYLVGVGLDALVKARYYFQLLEDIQYEDALNSMAEMKKPPPLSGKRLL